MSTLIHQALELHDRYGYIPMWQCVELAEKHGTPSRRRTGSQTQRAASDRGSRRRRPRRAGALRAWLL